MRGRIDLACYPERAFFLVVPRLNRPISAQSQVVRNLRAPVRILVSRLESRSRQEREEPWGSGRWNISYLGTFGASAMK
jgi:hypothetical protein